MAMHGTYILPQAGLVVFYAAGPMAVVVFIYGGTMYSRTWCWSAPRCSSSTS
jgi:hypothetical protein